MLRWVDIILFPDWRFSLFKSFWVPNYPMLISHEEICLWHLQCFIVSTVNAAQTPMINASMVISLIFASGFPSLCSISVFSYYVSVGSLWQAFWGNQLPCWRGWWNCQVLSERFSWSGQWNTLQSKCDKHYNGRWKGCEFVLSDTKFIYCIDHSGKNNFFSCYIFATGGSEIVW